MKTSLLLPTLATVVICSATHAAGQNVVAPAPPSSGATTIYRQVMADGRIVYSDKVAKGAKVDHTITMPPPLKGNLWTTESGTRPVIAPQIEPTPIKKVASLPTAGKRKPLDEAASDVIRAEMLLEDAEKRQAAGVEPLPGERTGNSSGGSRLNEAYGARQKLLAKEVSHAEAALKKAIAERDSLR